MKFRRKKKEEQIGQMPSAFAVHFCGAGHEALLVTRVSGLFPEEGTVNRQQVGANFFHAIFCCSARSVD
jgi:hypothetical protein